MKKLLHYSACFFRLLKKNLIKVFDDIRSLFYKFFNILNCLVKLKSTKTEGFEEKYILDKYYPDNGNISENINLLNNKYKCDLSIIIPFYNAEKYIVECVESIINQFTHYTYEIILIDDGSSDNTTDIIKKRLTYPCIKLLCQENSGQSVARNNGINNSSGRYLMFVDADDTLLPNAIDSLIVAAEETNSDIVEGNIVRFYDAITDEMLKDSKGNYHIESNEKNPIFVLTAYGYCFAKIYKRELWHTLRFPEGYIFEDIITKFILRRRANQVTFIQNVVYGYRMNNPTSSSHGANQTKKLDSIWVLPKIFELCKQEQVSRDDVFYLLALNHIGLLNYITTKSQSIDIRLACFTEMRKQLLSIQDCRPKRIPMMFKLLDRSILENNFAAWESIAEMIQRFHMLKKWREIN